MCLAMRQVVFAVTFSLFLACGGSAPAPRPQIQPAAATPPIFVNRAWRTVAPSDVAAGAIYVFLSDNTLLITSPAGTPQLGRWMMSGQELVMIEEGMSYRTDVVESSSDRLVLRQHNPKGNVTLVFTPARSLRGMESDRAQR
jgi:hypothetical protein